MPIVDTAQVLLAQLKDCLLTKENATASCEALVSAARSHPGYAIATTVGALAVGTVAVGLGFSCLSRRRSAGHSSASQHFHSTEASSPSPLVSEPVDGGAASPANGGATDPRADTDAHTPPPANDQHANGSDTPAAAAATEGSPSSRTRNKKKAG
jgi:hypothetical protein